MRRWMSVFFILLLMLPGTAWASEPQYDYEGFTGEGELSGFPELNFTIGPAAAYFSNAGCRIGKASSTAIEGTVMTSATQIVDKMGYVLYFQRLDGDRWVTIETRSKSYDNRLNINIDFYKSAARYRTYRVYVRHSITHNNKTYYQTSISNTIYLN